MHSCIDPLPSKQLGKVTVEILIGCHGNRVWIAIGKVLNLSYGVLVVMAIKFG